MERFRVARNQRFPSPPTMVGQELDISGNLCIPEPGHTTLLYSNSNPALALESLS